MPPRLTPTSNPAPPTSARRGRSGPWPPGLLTALLAALLGLSACGALGGALGGVAMGPSAGVTTGGAQDIGLARNQLAAGEIPSPSAFVIEGLLGEHDIALDAPPCAERFCLNTAVDVAPALDTGADALFMVVGFSSNIDLETFHRAPLNLAVVVDHSGSMGEGKMAAAREAIHRLIDQLDARDRLSIIEFDDDFDNLLDSTPMERDQRDLAHDITAQIRSDGGTDIEGALAEGFAEVLDEHAPNRRDRVILLTDAQPNSGRTDEDSFVGLTERYAAEGVGLTVFGIGLDFGQDLTLAISAVPGANYVYLEDAAKLARVFDEDFDLLVTPVAWDFELQVRPLPGFQITAAYGVPSWVAGAGDGAVTLHIPTLFLSRNRGAIVLRLEPLDGAPITVGTIADGALSYRDDRDGAPHRWREEVSLTADPLVLTADAGVRQAVTLVNTGLGLRGAAELAHAGRYTDALALLDEVERLTKTEAYRAERTLVEELREIVASYQEQPLSTETPAGHWPQEPAPSTARWIR